LGWIILSFSAAILLFNAAIYAYRAKVLHALDACDAVDPLGVLAAARAFAVECVATATVLLLIPVGWLLPHCRAGSGTRGALVLVHGWSLNRGCFWLMRRRLLCDGWGPVCCLDYRSLRLDVEGAAGRLRDAVDRLRATLGPAQPITLLGHSLGGLVLRYYARRYPAAGVRRIITLGTPHRGTRLAGMHRGYGRALAPDSAFLRALGANDRIPQQFDVVAIFSTFDAMIVPPRHAEYPGAFNVRITGVGHNALLLSRKVYELLAENLAAPLR
jgi:pimeloyl-ACP methyl ester carboxylesterase